MGASIVVVSGGLGVPSSSRMLGDQLARSTVSALAADGISAEVQVIELRELGVDIAKAMVAGWVSPQLEEAIEAVGSANAVVAVSPVFTASVSGLFKSFLDVLDPTLLDDKPVLLAATGGSSRHSMVIDYVMRPIFGYLRANTMPTAVFAAPGDWSDGSGSGALAERSDRAGAELARALGGRHGLSAARQDPMESLPFEQLLAEIRPEA
ncbi:MAG: FMN reductase [Arthrobacter sp.]|uniref:FMN reductase n=1 Tax=unclassified Arthrobacter TaxID=235627 RepID=UPI002655B4D1|nr:FMN reductase [Micrococcaceae bacterium]MDN5812472.1 FMN reductase [Micrococcaceae bacterium]MDN5825220.1 FMN reductase [Micrococcaceae bacterium]MDN5879937.1 FMN reductase [Micrococcaceae bacterium]MDN5887354.1 FMN reductase [Micrococcaceae bacterium]